MLNKNKWQALADEFVSLGKVAQICLYKPETPHGNLIVIFDKMPSDTLCLAPLVNKIIKKKLPSPLIIDADYLHTSLDSFPLEFLNIKSSYENLYAETDLLAAITIEKADVRLQVERELRGKYLLTHNAYLENYKYTSNLLALVNAATSSLIPVFKGILFWHDIDLEMSLDALVNRCANLSKLDLANIKKSLAYFQKTEKLDKKVAADFFRGYLSDIHSLIQFVDKLSN